MLKRLLTVLLSAVMCFGFVACRDKNSSSSNDSGNSSSSVSGGEEVVSNAIFPTKTSMKTDGQLYTGNAVEFPASLWETPNSERYDELDRDGLGVYGYFIDSVQDTQVFAFVGIPEGATKENPVPGIVLVHGGGGTAFFQWVSYWVKRGYAAIAMDTDGNMPVENSLMSNNNHQVSIKNHGPSNTRFADWKSKPIEQQWAYHATAAVIASNSFLRSFEGVDPNRIGVTGISFGAFLTCHAIAYDDRFSFAMPVYASLDQRSGETPWAELMAGDIGEVWDNNDILQGNTTPILYVNSNTDQGFSVKATTESDKKSLYSQMLLKYNFQHSHELGAFQVPELLTFADNICLGTEGLVQIIEQPTAEKQSVKVKLPKGVSVQEVTGYYTTSSELVKTTFWSPVDGDFEDGIAEVSIPGNAKYFYINVTDSRNMEVSSHVIALN